MASKLNWLDCTVYREQFTYPDRLRFTDIFDGDLNCDGDFTFSDVWELVKWGYYYPGDWVVTFFEAPDLLRFFEASNFYGTNMSAVLGFFFYAVLFSAFSSR